MTRTRPGRPPPYPGRLALWDEAVAFTGLFLLVRILSTAVLGMEGRLHASH
jgi:hypothetical protein